MRGLKVVSVAAVVFAAGASPALASAVHSNVTPDRAGYWIHAMAPDHAFSAWTNDFSGDRYFHVKDRHCDGQGGHGEYLEVSGYRGSLGNDSGCGTNVRRHTAHKIIGVKACTNRQWPQPDKCSKWVYKHTYHG